ncbi:Fujikurins efflux protein [Vanrija pseudolonga]|uniref:Fujikurins efflux protein n=1 Tax=Vanrija pseudolonga TaxID=143232 RepID=A0AAF1BIL2_9TREE|nr:Fujikurins efflux protein [Vanrija pseudolonga]
MFPHSESTVTLASNLQNGMLLVGVGLCGPLFAAMSPKLVLPVQLFGLVCGTLAFILTAFVTSAWQLVITLGILYPLSSLLFFPCIPILYDWFVERRGLASGIMFGGAAVGGTIFPLMTAKLLDAVKYKPTLYTIAAMFGSCNGVAMIFLRRRVPIAPVAPGRRVRPPINFAFLKRRGFWEMVTFVAITSLGSFIPSVWLPTFADAVGPTHPGGTGLVAIMYASSSFGNPMVGFLADRFPVGFVVTGMCTAAALAAWLLWGLGTNSALLVLFSMVWGMLALPLAATWSQMISYVARDDPALPMLLFSICAFVRGSINFASGPISTALLKSGVLRGAAGAYGTTNYGALLLFTGAVTFVGGLAAAFFPRR